MDPVNQQWGKYRIRRLIARGGMAEVFEAEMLGPAGFIKPVCLKRVRPELSSNPEFVEMFQNEARIAAMLHHANIVSVFDFDLHKEELFLVMELVEGMDLHAILRESKTRGVVISPEMVVYIADSLLAALEHAHTRKVDGVSRPVIHRDISPHNVLISRDGVVKLADFGIAKSRGLSNATRDGVIKGKLAYLSPEQLSGNPVTPLSDLFSFGLVLTELLTGERQFKGEGNAALVQRAMGAAFEPIPSVPRSMNHLLGGLLAPDPLDRYPSAHSARAALQRIDIPPAGEAAAAALVAALMPRVETPTLSTRPICPPPGMSSREAKTALAVSPEQTGTVTVATRIEGAGPRRRKPGHAGVYAAGISFAVLILGSAILFGRSRQKEPRTTTVMRQSTPPPSTPASTMPPPGSAPETTPNVTTNVMSHAVSSVHAVNEPSVTIPMNSDTSDSPVEKTIRPKRRPRITAVTPPPAGEEPSPVPDPIVQSPGTLNVNVRPWATVVVDGRDRGTTPIKGLSLSPGKHRITLENGPLGYREKMTVEVVSEKCTSVARKIEKKN